MSKVLRPPAKKRLPPARAIKSTFPSHILESESGPARKKDSKGKFLLRGRFKRQRGLLRGIFCRIPRMRLHYKERTRSCDQLREHMNLSLVPLRMNSDGDIFPSRAFFSVKSALPLGHALRRKIIYKLYTTKCKYCKYFAACAFIL